MGRLDKVVAFTLVIMASDYENQRTIGLAGLLQRKINTQELEAGSEILTLMNLLRQTYVR